MASSDFIINNGILEKYVGSGRDVAIPDGVKKIGDCAFEANQNLCSVLIPCGVEEIGESAFAHCTNLKQVCFPEGVKRIRCKAFCECENLEAIDIPFGLKYLDSAFTGCKKLKTVRLPEGVHTVGRFEGCISLVRFDFPDTVFSIERHAFYNCKNLREVHLPARLDKIPFRCFYLCQRLETVNIPQVKEICAGAFYRCENLKELTLPDSILEIDKDVFKDPFLPIYPEKGNSFTVLDWLKNLTIHAPKGSVGEAFAKKAKISYDNKLPESAASECFSNPWMTAYGQYVERNPEVHFEGSAFVFSGLPMADSDARDHRTVCAVIERGGIFRTTVSGKTNYLIVDPEFSHSGRIEAVLEQRRKGKDIKVILLSDLDRILFG